MRIAHFSDPHLLSIDGARLRDIFNKRWLGVVNLLTHRAREHKLEVFEALAADINGQSIDHVICTGDITNVALRGEFAFARRQFERFDHGTDAMTVIPGNHDAYVAAGLPLYEEYFGDLCATDEGWEWPDGSAWPTVRVRGQLAIVCLSTSHPTPWFQAWGRLGSEQLARAEQVLSDARLAGKFRLVAVHHPPAGPYAPKKRHGLHDYATFADVIERAGAELVLHGHEHRDLRAELPGPAGARVPVHGIQSGTYLGPRESHRARYRVYDIATDGTATMALRGFDPQSHAFRPEADGPAGEPVVAVSG